MRVVSALNLVSSETEKTTAWIFQTINSFIMSLDFMRGEIGAEAGVRRFSSK